MVLKPGDDAPDLSIVPRTSADRPLVLFFFPKAFTPVCTAEACAFRDAGGTLTDRADVVGVSSDSAETLDRFARENGIKYPLVADAGGKLGRAFGTGWLGGLIPVPGRCTFVIHGGRIVDAYRSELGSSAHVEAATKALDSLAT